MTALFLEILTVVTLQIIAMIALGWLLQPRLKLDVGTLNRLQIYVVMPAFLIHFLSTAKQPLSEVFPVFYLGIAQLSVLVPLGWLVVLILRQRRTLGPMMGIATFYANVGFYGLPLTLLAFGPDYVIYQSVLTAIMSVFVVTVGVWLLAPESAGMGTRLKAALASPLLPAVVLGLALRGFEIKLPAMIGQPIQFLGSIFTPLALYTLGAQIASTPITRFEPVPQVLALLLKFLVAPAVTWGLCILMGFPPDVTAVIVVATATPVGVIVTVLAMEYKNEVDFISTAVVVSTLLSPVVVTAWLIVMRLK